MDHASFSLDSLPPSDSRCPYCGKDDQSVSHGYVYKHTSHGPREIVGKRILCSRHNGRSGCGRTRQWYLADVIPRRRYRLSVFIGFIQALFDGDSVELAYLKAMAFPPKEPRQAWRWLQRFRQQLPQWRSHLSLTDEVSRQQHASSLLTIVLPTLRALCHQLGHLMCFQNQYQQAFC